MNHFGTLLLFIIFLLPKSGATQEWKLVKDDDAINVYTRKVEGQSIKDVKIKTTINTTLTEMVAALEDFDLQESWVRNTNESRKVEAISPSHFFFYVGTDFPFPAKDRDAVIEYKRTQDPNSKIIQIDYEAFPNKLPKSSDYVRMPELIASYTLTPNNDNSIDVEYYIRVDIGGKIPSWIINMAISVGPRDTMVALKKVLASGQYADVMIEGVEEL